MASFKPRGPVGVIFASVFVAIVALEVWAMRVGPVSKRVGVLLEPAVDANFIKEYGDMELRRHYTGIESVDFGLRFLVTAFMAGASGVDNGALLQQAHFLLSFFPIIAIMSIEAGRKRNAGSLLYFTSIWALLYQTVGGAIVIPLYHLAYMWTSSGTDYWNPSTRGVPVAYARALLPALLIGYLLPTILIYLPYGNISTTQGFVALWQPSPLFVNLLLVIFTRIYGSKTSNPSPETSSDPGDVKHLKIIYNLSLTIGALTHWTALGLHIFSDDPNLSLGHALWPDKELFSGDNLTPTLVQGLHYIFQMDYWGIIVSFLFLTILGTFDTNRAFGRTVITYPEALTAISVDTLIYGPAAAVAASWSLRESALASLHKSKKL